MNPSVAIVQDQANGIFRTDVPKGMTAISDPSCAALIWDRQPAAHFQNWINGLNPDLLPKARLILRPDRVCEALIDVAEMCGTPRCPERDMLVEDISALAAIFSSAVKTSYIRLRLDVVTGNACCKFHIDAVTARLVCTYRGTGTQYGVSKNGVDPDPVMTVPTGAPIILRGTAWPETPLSGLLHRSPPIEGRNQTRLLLVLDPVEEPDSAIGKTYIH